MSVDVKVVTIILQTFYAVNPDLSVLHDDGLSKSVHSFELCKMRHLDLQLVVPPRQYIAKCNA